MEHNHHANLAQQFLESDGFSFEEMLGLLNGNGSVEGSNSEERDYPLVKAIRPKSLGTRLSETERRNRLLKLPDLGAEELNLKPRTKYYFFISIPAELSIKATKNWARKSEKMIQILETFGDQRGTFFKLIHSSLTLTQYVFEFYDKRNGSAEKLPVRTFVVKMIGGNNNNNNIEPMDDDDEPKAIHSKPRNNKRRRIEALEDYPVDGSDPDLVVQKYPESIANLHYRHNSPLNDGYSSLNCNSPDIAALEALQLAEKPSPIIDPFISVTFGTPNADTSNVFPIIQHRQYIQPAVVAPETPNALIVQTAKRSGFPPKKGPKIDQTNLLAEVARKLHEKRVLIIHGMSGVGKSTLASEFGYMERLRDDQYDYAVWIDCKNDKTLMASFGRIAKFLNIKNSNGDQEHLTVLETLQSSKCLVIFDNCNENMVEDVFDSFFPNDPNPCHVIVTTQLPESKWMVERMEVAHMTLENYPDEHILQYIFKVLRIQDPTQETLQAAKDVIREYKSFTLLMQLIPQYIRMEDLTLPDFMRKYRDMFVTLAPLNIDRLDIPVKMIIDSLDLKNKMFLRLLSFMNSLAGTQVFTESVFFVEDQLSNTKFSDLKRAVSKLKNLSLIEFFDDGQAVKIGHEWIEQYLTRSTSQEDLRLIYTHWDRLFGGLIQVERAKCEVSDVFAILLKDLQIMDQATKLKFINTATDNLVNWTSPRPPKFYVDFLEAMSNTKPPYYQQSIICGVTKKEPVLLHHALERISMENIGNNLHVMIASFYYARMLSEKGHFNESLQLLDRCQNYMLQYLDERHSFCQNVYREYAIALHRAGHYAQADPILTKCFVDSRIKNDTNCYYGINKFRMGDYDGAWTILKEYIIDTIKHKNQCDLDSASMKEGLATFLFCEIMLNKPFPAIIHQDVEIQLHQALHHATTLYQTHRRLFQADEITVNQQTLSIGQFHNGPEQQYTAIGCQGRVIIIYKLAIMDYWCIVYMNNFIWV